MHVLVLTIEWFYYVHGTNTIKKKTLFSSKLDLIWKKLVKWHIWSTASCCTATWTLQTINQKYLKSSEMSCRRTEISCTDHVKNEEVLQRVKKEMNVLHTIKQRGADWTGHNLHRNCLLNHAIEGTIEVMGTKNRMHKQSLDGLKAKKKYWKLRETALDCILWRTHFAWGYGPVVRQIMWWWWWWWWRQYSWVITKLLHVIPHPL